MRVLARPLDPRDVLRESVFEIRARSGREGCRESFAAAVQDSVGRGNGLAEIEK